MKLFVKVATKYYKTRTKLPHKWNLIVETTTYARDMLLFGSYYFDSSSRLYMMVLKSLTDCLFREKGEPEDVTAVRILLTLR